MRILKSLACSLLIISLALPLPLAGQEEDTDKPAPAAQATEDQAEGQVPDKAELYRRFAETMSGAKLVGKFTVLGQQQQEQELPKEEYEIRSATKLPAGDVWLITARIKYGDHDVTLPMPLQVKWAGDTPVITLTDLTIPGLGTFSARVVLHEGKYAGTWRHGEVGGHLFGTIEKEEKKPEQPAAP